MKRFGMVALLTMSLVIASIAPALAKGQGKPVIREKNTFVEELHKEDFLSDVCGIDVYVEGSGRDTFNMYADGSVVVHFGSTFYFSSPDTGETLIRTDAATFRGQGEEVFDPIAETVTITFKDQFTGNPAKWRKKGEGVLLRDAGIAWFEGTVILDISGPFPVEIFFEETITTRGPHPELETDVLAFICEALGA